MGKFRWLAIAVVLWAVCAGARAQVFTVGEKSATADIATDFKPTHVELPGQTLTERGRRELVRNLQAEQGFAHRVLPLGGILTLQANGRLTPGPDAYKMMVYKKGQAAAPGDRVSITGLEFKGDRILVDLNGGPYVPHRFLRHLSVSVGGLETNPNPVLDEAPTGCRITLVFEGGIPDISAPDVKALLEPIVDFGVKTGPQAYADTLPTPVKNAIAAHDVLVGMDRRMVLAALGSPENKVRETVNGERYEEWIYGHQPQTVRFVRFVGDRVSQVKIAALGKPIEVHDQDELAGYLPPKPVKTTNVNDAPNVSHGGPPSLLNPGEKPVMDTGVEQHKVQMPADKPAPAPVPQQWTGGSR